MDGGRLYGGSDFLPFFDNPNLSLWIPSSSNTSVHETMVNFNSQEAQQGRSRLSPNPNPDDEEETGGEEFEMNPFHHPEKKRRLTQEQVKSLEKSFEVENKLEPERKVQLAKELGLEPRQVAIWFQNRRARFKTKQLEKDYGSLKASYDRLKASFDALVKDRDVLQNEIKLLTKKLKERGMVGTESDPGCPVNPLHVDTKHEELPELGIAKMPKMEPTSSSNKQVEDASSAKSGVFDSPDPDQDRQSDCSPENENRRLIDMGKNLVFPHTPPAPALFNNKVEDTECYDPPCNLPVADDHPFWSWLY